MLGRTARPAAEGRPEAWLGARIRIRAPSGRPERPQPRGARARGVVGAMADLDLYGDRGHTERPHPQKSDVTKCINLSCSE